MTHHTQTKELTTWFLILLIFVATALSRGTCIGLAGLPHLWDRRCMPGAAFYGPGALVCQAEELNNILNVVRGELL
jgi:hypothetical protein